MCEESTEPRSGWFRICVSILVVAASVIIVVASNHYERERNRADIAHKRAQATQLKALGLASFDKLDSDHDGLLFEEELRNDVIDSSLTGADLDIARDLYARCKDIGHSIGSYRSGKFRIQVYAISRADLKLLPVNTEKELRHRYGSDVDQVPEN